MNKIRRPPETRVLARAAALALLLIVCFAACDRDDSTRVVAPKRVGETSVETVASGTAPNLVLNIVNNDHNAARIEVDLNGSRAVDHRFAGSSGDPHPAVHTFEYRLPGDAIEVMVRAGDRSKSVRVNPSTGPVNWVVIQNYPSNERGVEVTTYAERPQFG